MNYRLIPFAVKSRREASMRTGRLHSVEILVRLAYVQTRSSPELTTLEYCLLEPNRTVPQNR